MFSVVVALIFYNAGPPSFVFFMRVTILSHRNEQPLKNK